MTKKLKPIQLNKSKTSWNKGQQKTSNFAIKNGAQTPLNSEHYPHLHTLLQTTLDINELLDLFFNELQQHFSISSCQYNNDKESLSIQLGLICKQSCTYSLLTTEEHIGIIQISRSKRFTKQELALLEDMILTIVYPLRNALHYHQAIKRALTDGLTEVGNRISMLNTLKQDIETAHRYNQPLSVLMIDIDNFKNVNDHYGHCAGDYTLKKIAGIIKECSRCADRTFRYGGEEFIVILTNTNKTGAKTFAERLRATIAGTSYIYNDQEIPLTVSIGCAAYKIGESSEFLIQKADEGLYKAKGLGKNRVINIEDFNAAESIKTTAQTL